MKAVLIVVAGLLAISAQAQDSCPTPTYTQDIVPVCQSDWRIKLPSYADPTSYYSCATGAPVLTKCVAPTLYFSYVLQECSTCANYKPAVECSQNKLGLECVAIGTTTAPPTATTSSGSTVTTTAGSTVTTTAGSTATGTTTTGTTTTGSTTTTTATATTTTAAPGTTSEDDDEPTGTTIYVPPPPSPGRDLPVPPSPEPTARIIVDGPPTLRF